MLALYPVDVGSIPYTIYCSLSIVRGHSEHKVRSGKPLTLSGMSKGKKIKETSLTEKLMSEYFYFKLPFPGPER